MKQAKTIKIQPILKNIDNAIRIAENEKAEIEKSLSDRKQLIARLKRTRQALINNK